MLYSVHSVNMKYSYVYTYMYVYSYVYTCMYVYVYSYVYVYHNNAKPFPCQWITDCNVWGGGREERGEVIAKWEYDMPAFNTRD